MELEELGAASLDAQRAVGELDSSLLSLFESEFFDCWMCVLYLHRYQTKGPVVRYLCSRLYLFEDEDIEFYLPQLCNLYLLIEHHSSMLENFFLDKSSYSIHFALRLYCLFDSWNDGKADRFRQRRIRMLENIERALVNGDRQGSFLKSGLDEGLSEELVREFNTLPSIRHLSIHSNARLVACDSASGSTCAAAPPPGADGDHLQLQAFESYRSQPVSLFPPPSPAAAEAGPFLSTEASNGRGSAASSPILRSQSAAQLSGAGEEEEDTGMHHVASMDLLRLEESVEGGKGEPGEPTLSLSHAQDLSSGEPSGAAPTVGLEGARNLPVYGEGTSFNLDVIPGESRGVAASATSSDGGSVDGTAAAAAAAAAAGAAGRTPSLPSPAWSHSDLSLSNVLASTHSLSKQHKCDFFNLVLRFLRFLTNLSEELRSFQPTYYRNIPPPPLPPRLRSRLADPDKVIPAGFYFPVESASAPHYQVVSILADECIVFSSRTRAPYMILAEVLRSSVHCSHPEINMTTPPAQQLAESPQAAGSGENWGSEAAEGPSNPTAFHQLLQESCSVSNPELDAPMGSHPLKREFRGGENLRPVQRYGELVPDDDGLNEVIKRAVFRETWKEKRDRYRQTSPFGHLDNYDVVSLVVKAGDDIRQEELAMQLLRQFHRIFQSAKLPMWLCPYRIFVNCPGCGFIETVPNAVSIDHIKKSVPNFVSLKDYFERLYGANTPRLADAKRNFTESMAAYSIVTYILQVKDRHNANLMLDTDGHIIHIDFGFMLSNSPGAINFESAPFKLTEELVDIMDGADSDLFRYFRTLVNRGFEEVRKRHERIVSLVDMLLPGGDLPCFKGGLSVVEELKERFNFAATEAEFEDWVNGLISESLCNWRSRRYDDFQRYTNNIQ